MSKPQGEWPRLIKPWLKTYWPHGYYHDRTLGSTRGLGFIYCVCCQDENGAIFCCALARIEEDSVRIINQQLSYELRLRRAEGSSGPDMSYDHKKAKEVIIKIEDGPGFERLPLILDANHDLATRLGVYRRQNAERA